jgi:hypothetical protein
MSYIPEYHENYYRVEGTAYNQGKIGIGTINPVQLLHVSGGNIRVDGTGYINGDLNVTGNLNVYGTTAQFAVSQVIAEDKSLELNVATGTAIGGGNYTTVAFTDDAGANDGGLLLKSSSIDAIRGVQDKAIVYRTSTPNSGWVSNLRFVVSGNYGKDTLQLSDTTANVGLTIATDTNLYRSGANTLRTDSNLGVVSNFNVDGNTTLGDTTSDTISFNARANSNLEPSSNNAVNLGSSALNWGTVFVNTLQVAANSTLTGDLSVQGNTTLGDATSDTVTFNARAASDLTPSTNNVRNLGSSALNWLTAYVNTLQVGANSTLTGDLSVQGNTTLGDATSDTVTFNARAASDLTPSTNNARNLGSTALNWSTAYVNTLQVAANSTLTGNLNVNGNTTLGDAYTDTVLITGKLLRGVLTYSGAGVTTQASSTTIASDKVIVTGAGVANGALTLPAALAGMEIEVKNRAGQSISVYANPTTDRIFDSSTLIANNTALALASNTNKNFVCAPSGGINVWFT